MTPINATFLVPRYWPAMGGAEMHSRALIHALPSDVKPSVGKVCSETPHATDTAYAFSQAQSINDDGVETHQLAPTGLMSRVLKRLASHYPDSRISRGVFGVLARHALRRNLNHLFANADLNHVIYNGCTPLAMAAAASSKPFVFTPLAHTTKPEGTAWSSPGFKALYQRADALIAMTEYERNWLIEQGASPYTTHVVPMAPLLDDTVTPDPEGFRARYGIGDAPMVLFLGRMAEYKGYQALLDARHEIWRHHPETRLVFAGPGTRKSDAAFKALKGDPRIINLGRTGERQKQSALAACTLLSVPSTEESLGVIYLEAWRFGKPVIAARTPVMESVISEGDDGLLTEPVGWKLARAITSLLDTPEIAQAMGQHGRQKVNLHYTWEGSAHRLSEIYHHILTR